VRDCAGFGDADGWRNCFYGDARQRSAGDIYFYDSGNGRNANPCDPPETLTVTGASTDFTWTDTGSDTATVLAGQSATYTFSAAPASGTFGANVTFACSGLPALTSGGVGAGCEFNPATIAAGASGTTAVTVTVWTCGPNLPTDCAAGRAGCAAVIGGGAVGAGSGGRASANLAFLRTRLVHVCGVGGMERARPVRCVSILGWRECAPRSDCWR